MVSNYFKHRRQRDSIFNGKTAENTFWSAIKVISLSEEEKQQPKYKGLKYKSDPKSLKEFGNDFIEACDFIGMFEE